MGKKQIDEKVKIAAKHEQGVEGLNSNYKEKYGFNVPENAVFKTQRGLNEGIVRQISEMKKEPKWMTDFRLKSYKIFRDKPMPQWGGQLNNINFEDIYYYLKPSQGEGKSWDDIPKDIKDTFDRLGVPEAERNHLAGIKAQFDSEVVYGSLLKELEEEGIIFMGTDEALKKHPEIFEEYFGKVIPPHDNKFAALNSAVWSGGSFVYIPKGVKVKRPLQAYFRINAINMGQFERTLIIADEGSEAHYVEGCFTAGHQIKTSEGFKNIEDITEGDKVLTHKGRFKSVYNIQKRPYSGDLYDIKVYGIPDLITATEEHPFYAAKRKLKNEKNSIFETTWIEANTLKKKDYLTIPVNRKVSSEKTKTFTVDFKGEKKKINVKLTPEFFRLIGYYLAEGSCEDKGYLRFSFNASEQKYIKDVKKIVSDVFEIKKSNEFTYKDRAGVELVFNSAILARIFKQFGTSAGTKSLPSWVSNADPVLQKELIIGYFRGDGNYYKKKNKHGLKEVFRMNTVSRDLAFQIRDVLLRLDIFAFINIRNRRKEGRQTMYTVGVGGGFVPLFGKLVGTSVETKLNGKNRASMFSIDKDFAYLPIKKISRRKVKSVDVFNFSVQDDESYVVNSVSAHNCTAPVYSADSLHSAVVEVIVKKGARFRYTTIQNWSNDVYNLVTKRARVEEDGIMEWIDGNLGSRLTMKYPSCYLVGERAHGEVLSIAYAAEGQHQDAGAKMFHLAPNTTSTIVSKSVSLRGGRSSYRGMVVVTPAAPNAKSRVECDALILDSISRTDTYPVMKIDHPSANIEHEATVSKLGEEKMFYLMSRGLTEVEAMGLIVSGFIEPIVKELPLEYAVELNRLIELEMEGSVG